MIVIVVIVVIGCVNYLVVFFVVVLVDYSYKIGFGDNFNIVVWCNFEFFMFVFVCLDGKILVLLIDDFNVMGKDFISLVWDIEKEFGKFICDLVVIVIVIGFVGFYSE